MTSPLLFLTRLEQGLAGLWVLKGMLDSQWLWSRTQDHGWVGDLSTGKECTKMRCSSPHLKHSRVKSRGVLEEGTKDVCLHLHDMMGEGIGCSPSEFPRNTTTGGSNLSGVKSVQEP